MTGSGFTTPAARLRLLRNRGRVADTLLLVAVAEVLRQVPVLTQRHALPARLTVGCRDSTLGVSPETPVHGHPGTLPDALPAHGAGSPGVRLHSFHNCSPLLWSCGRRSPPHFTGGGLLCWCYLELFRSLIACQYPACV